MPNGNETSRELDPKHRILALRVHKTSPEMSIYHAVRCAWKLSRKRAECADYIFAVDGEKCVGVFVADKWLEATQDNFPDRDDLQGLSTPRWGFYGKEADKEIQKLYKNKKLPKEYLGGRNPVRYINC